MNASNAVMQFCALCLYVKRGKSNQIKFKKFWMIVLMLIWNQCANRITALEASQVPLETRLDKTSHWPLQIEGTTKISSNQLKETNRLHFL